jgi:hypothetical protein
MWLPDDLEECPVCHRPPEHKRTPMELMFYGILAVAIAMLVVGIAMPRQLFGFIQAIDIEFIEITNGSEALVSKLGFGNDSLALSRWEEEISDLLVNGTNSSAVENIIRSRFKEGEYLKNVDSLANFATMNIRYREKRNYTDVNTILNKFSGDDRAHVIVLASLFNASDIDFRVDLVEDGGKDGPGYHFRTMIGTTLPEEDLEKIITRRIRKRRSGLSGTKAEVWFVQEGEIRWYLVDTTGQTIKRRDSLVDTSWIFIGSSHPYYANRSHYSFELGLG